MAVVAKDREIPRLVGIDYESALLWSEALEKSSDSQCSSARCVALRLPAQMLASCVKGRKAHRVLSRVAPSGPHQSPRLNPGRRNPLCKAVCTAGNGVTSLHDRPDLTTGRKLIFHL